MARLNTRPPNVSRDSSETASGTPQPGEENQDPCGTARSKGKARAMDPPPRPTSTSDSRSTPDSRISLNASHEQKRKRMESRLQTDEEARGERLKEFYDPYQDPEERRHTKRQTRELERDILENRDELLKDAERLRSVVARSNDLYKEVKQTGDATVDSRILVNVSELSRKKAQTLVLGDNSSGLDVDEFLGKCLSFLKHGRALHGQAGAPTSSRTRQTAESEDDDEDIDGEPLDWARFGREACFVHSSRPPLPSFLLGPLSVEKRQRAVTQRRARVENTGKEARPETVNKEDLGGSNENALLEICKGIWRILDSHIKKAGERLMRAGINSIEMLDTPEARPILRKYRLSTNGQPSLFEFVVNPHSFGQTVENIFYVSFLIKEGTLAVNEDKDGLPTIDIRGAAQEEQARSAKTAKPTKSTKHQAVFAIDYGTWEKLKQAFDIREPMIPHRDEAAATQMGPKGWYT